MHLFNHTVLSKIGAQVWIVDEKFSLIDGNHLDEAFRYIEVRVELIVDFRDRIFFFFFYIKYKKKIFFLILRRNVCPWIL